MRWRFAALALALLVPSGLLVHRAWSGVAAERSARQAALAERVFDEMERALSELVAREESRPVAHWRATWTPPGAAPGTRVPSPLAEAPEQPFVLGWFEIRPDGEIGTPHADAARAARVVAAVEQHLAAHASMPGAGIDFVDDSLGKAMMGTGELAQARERAQEIPPGMAPASEEAQASPAPRAEAADDLYSAFRSLNRGIEQRAGRTRKLLPASEPVAEIDAEAALDADAVASSVARRDPTARSSTELEGAARAEAEEQAAASSRLQAAKRSDARTRVARELAPADAPAVAGRVAARRRNAVAVDPLRGYAAPDGPLVLMRTLWHADGATRQGVVIDLDALADWLRERAFGAEGFPGAELAIGPVWSPLEIPDGGALHRHAFAEPFGVLEAGLHLAW